MKKYLLIAQFDEDDGNYMCIKIKENNLKDFTKNGQLDDEQKKLINDIVNEYYIEEFDAEDDDLEDIFEHNVYIMRKGEIEIYDEYNHTIIKQVEL